jgi:hypothetical protein
MRYSWAKLESMPRPSEAETEAEFIFPALNILGWHHLPQQVRWPPNPGQESG